MKNNKNAAFTPKQKQAVVVCVVCTLALIITICITAVQVAKASKNSDEEVPSSSTSASTTTGYTGENYVVDPDQNTSVLIETDDMGKEYLKETLFIGDSNTLRFYNNGLLTTQQFCAMEGLTIQNALTEKFVSFKKDTTLYTIAESVAKMKPRRIIITLGTNNVDGSLDEAAFVAAYQTFVQAILDSYAYTDIIINAIPPVTEESLSTYPKISQETIDDYNMALAEFAKDNDFKFLNSAEVLKDATGYGDADYYVANDIHLKAAGLNAILKYVTTHAYIADDRRPDTDNIAIRSGSVTSNGSSSASSSATASYTAKYFVDSAGGGTLTSGDDKNKANLSFDIEEKSDSITVTAVPDEGYVFVKWSDDVKTPTRKDSDFTKNVNVTAMFATLGITIELNTKDPAVGMNVEFEAKLTGNYASINDVVWYVNDVKNAASAVGKSWLTIESNTEYTVYAAVTYNGTTIKSASIVIAPPKEVKVPKIEGMLESEAKAILENAGLTVGTIEYKETTDSSQIGRVTHQATAAGETAIEKSKINFTVGKAVTTYAVPAVTGKTEAEAKSLLSKFTNCKYTTAYSDTVASGLVISQSISAGSSVSAGTDISIVVSLGPKPTPSPTPAPTAEPTPTPAPTAEPTPAQTATAAPTDVPTT